MPPTLRPHIKWTRVMGLTFMLLGLSIFANGQDSDLRPEERETSRTQHPTNSVDMSADVKTTDNTVIPGAHNFYLSGDLNLWMKGTLNYESQFKRDSLKNRYHYIRTSAGYGGTWFGDYGPFFGIGYTGMYGKGPFYLELSLGAYAYFEGMQYGDYEFKYTLPAPIADIGMRYVKEGEFLRVYLSAIGAGFGFGWTF